MDALIEELNNEHLKKDLPKFSVGDTIRVSTKIIEGGKERIQIFQGTVIARKGKGLAETFSLHRVSYGEGMERVFNLHSPRIVKIEVVTHGDVRRAKLYYLRGTSGKKSKVAQKIGGKKGKDAPKKEAKPKAKPKVTKVEATPDEQAQVEEALAEVSVEAAAKD